MEGFVGAGASQSLAAYTKLWTDLDTPSAANSYADVLLKTLTTTEKKHAEKEKSLAPGMEKAKSIVFGDGAWGTPDAKIAVHQLRIATANTLAFLALAKPISNADPHFAAALAQWAKRSEKAEMSEFIEHVIIKLCNATQIEAPHIEFLMESIVAIRCTRGGECPLPPSEELADGLAISRALVYQFVVDCYSRGQYQQLILDSLIMQLKSQPSDNALMAILFFLRTLLALRPVRDAAMIRRLSLAVQPFFLYSLPHGLAAKDVLHFLQHESRAPGSGRLALCRRYLAHLPTATALPEARVLHVVHAVTNRSSGLFRLLIDAISARSARQESSNAHWIDLLLVLLQSGSDLPAAEWDTLAPALQATPIPSPQVADLLHRVYDVVRNASANEGDDGRERMAAALQPIVAEVKKLVSEKQGGETAAVDGEVRESPFGRGKDSSPSAATGFVAWPPYSRVETLPLTFEGFRDATVGRSHYVTTASQDHLAVMLSKYVGETGPQRATARFVVAGDDLTLHNFVCSYVGLRQTQAELFSFCDIALFLVPLGPNNNLASYLASYDGWYARHVYAPFSSALPFLPTPDTPRTPLSTSAAASMSSSSSGGGEEISGEWKSTPLGLMQRLLDAYVAEAVQVLPVNVYDCECWSLAAGDSEPQLKCTIPFCQRIEIGSYSVKDHRGKRVPYFELREDKPSKISGIDLRITYTMMNILGVPRQKPNVDSKLFYSLVLSNVPRVGERATLSNPSAEWLEMYSLDVDPQVMKKRKNKLFGEMDYGRTHHVAHADIEANNRSQPFMVQIDGEMYGPYHRIRIAPSKIPGTTETIYLPVHHFLPLDL